MDYVDESDVVMFTVKLTLEIRKCFKACCFAERHSQGRTYPLGKGRRPPRAPKSQGPPKKLFIYQMRIKHGRGHANGCCLLCLLPRQPSACPS